MSTDFILPDIGEGIVECEVVEWLVQEGDTIAEDQPICDVMTDKALVQIPAVSDGVVSKLYYQKGEIAKVHAPLFSFVEQGNEAAAVTETVTEQAQVAQATANTATQVEDFLLPDIGEGIVECELVEWLVAEGDEVKEDQPICDVMTDKALVQIPAKNDGVIHKLYYNKGDIAKVHSPLFAITTADADVPQAVAAPVVEKTPAQSQTQPKAATNVPANNNGKAVASPAVRRLARENNINIADVVGSGDKGRVYKEDIHAHLTGATKPMSAPVQNTTTSVAQAEVKVEKISGIKAAMAKAMTESVSTIPHFTYSDEIDLTALVKLRAALKEDYKKQGIKLTMMPFFVKAMSLALREFPILNAKVNADCSEISYYPDHNIGMAVDSKVGLLVPNIKHCQNKSIKQIALDVMELTDKAREGRLSPDQLKGGTISISNIGALGGTTATPIINKPEVAIVALGKMQSLPRFDDAGNVVAKKLMNVSWSGDHRIIDGGTIARFNNLWTHYLQNPSAMMMEMS